MIQNTNDGTSAAPYLRTDFNMGNAWELPAWSAGPKDTEGALAKVTAIKAAGYKGIQGSAEEAVIARSLGLGATGGGRFNKPEELEPQVVSWKNAGFSAATLHVGWGHEDDATIDALVETVIRLSAQYSIPLYIETHRATITQDYWRTVQFTKRHPDIRFNGDFSHWYSGLEMPYGDITEKFNFMMPVLERVRFIHARCGNSSHIQVPLNDPSMNAAMAHFKDVWTRCMVGFLKTASPGDYLSFNPELLPSSINYARLVTGPDGQLREESDRWTEARRLTVIAQECFAEAKKLNAGQASKA